MIAIYSDTGAKLLRHQCRGEQGQQHLDLGRQRTVRPRRCRTAATRSRWPAQNADGTVSALTYSVLGTATGVQSLSKGVALQLGALAVPFSEVVSVN